MAIKKPKTLLQKLKIQFIILGSFLALFWLTESIDYLLGGALNQFGVIPRTTAGLCGILFAPFLHGSFLHLSGNSIPFFILGWFILLRGTAPFFGIFTVVMIVAGLGTWLVGSANTVHIGCSGIIFGFLGFLLVSALLERSLKSILLSTFAAILYGGIVFGILPGQTGISWETHLFGFVGGIIAAKLFSKKQTHHSQKNFT